MCLKVSQQAHLYSISCLVSAIIDKNSFYQSSPKWVWASENNWNTVHKVFELYEVYNPAVKLDFEIAVDHHTMARDQTFNGVYEQNTI